MCPCFVLASASTPSIYIDLTSWVEINELVSVFPNTELSSITIY